MVAHFLASRGHLAHDGPACELEIHALVVRLSGHEEELLLEPDEGLDSGYTLKTRNRAAVERIIQCYSSHTHSGIAERAE